MKTGQALRGAARLAFDTVEGVTHIVEGMHRNIAATPLPLGEAPEGPAPGIAGLVHESIRRVNGTVRDASEWALKPVSHHIDRAWAPGPRREAAIAALNGVCGDHLVSTDNPLAISMRLRVFLPPLEVDDPSTELNAQANTGAEHGAEIDPSPEADDSPGFFANLYETEKRPVEIHPEPTALADPDFSATGRLLILAHGLCMTDREWTARQHNHGHMLADAHGYTPVYALYNSGRHVSTNGRELCEQITALVDVWPVPIESITIIGFSMGGLITRSALHFAEGQGEAWLRKIDKVAYVGTPHHGAAMERGGYKLQKSVTHSPYTAPLAALGRVRSTGITDLRHGNVQEDDWQHHDAHEDDADHRRPTPLVEGIEHYAIAATLSKQPAQSPAKLRSDGLVHPSSGMGHHTNPDLDLGIPESHTSIVYGVGHMAMLHDQRVAEQLNEWLKPQLT